MHATPHAWTQARVRGQRCSAESSGLRFAMQAVCEGTRGGAVVCDARLIQGRFSLEPAAAVHVNNCMWTSGPQMYMCWIRGWPHPKCDVQHGRV